MNALTEWASTCTLPPEPPTTTWAARQIVAMAKAIIADAQEEETATNVEKEDESDLERDQYEQELYEHIDSLEEKLARAEGRRVQLEHSDIWLKCHAKDECKGEHCTLHKRSDHHMRHMKQNWRGDAGFMERICEHGIGHPDPDEIAAEDVHGCDGCCRTGAKARLIAIDEPMGGIDKQRHKYEYCEHHPSEITFAWTGVKSYSIYEYEMCGEGAATRKDAGTIGSEMTAEPRDGESSELSVTPPPTPAEIAEAMVDEYLDAVRRTDEEDEDWPDELWLEATDNLNAHLNGNTRQNCRLLTAIITRALEIRDQ